MHDIKDIRANPQKYADSWTARGLSGSDLVEHFLTLDRILRETMTAAETLVSERNKLTKSGFNEEIRAKLNVMKIEITALEHEVDTKKAVIKAELEALPNTLDATVPIGKDEAENQLVETFVAVKKPATITRDHADLGETHYGMDFEAAVRMSGTRFTFLHGHIAKLERAIGQFMLDQQTDNGFRECSPPLLVNANAMYGTGQLPKFEHDLFKTEDGKYLIPTAEVSLTNFVSDQIIDQKDWDLPIRLAALTHCFRLEAGSAGRDTRGILRQHQFQKVEMVSICPPDKSAKEHEFMLNCAEGVLKKLDISFRTMLLCSGDTGFGSRKTYDIEAWLPSQNTYREISSVSNCGDFQARRMNARFRDVNGKPIFVHTLNGSGLAVGRTLIAVMENYQDEGGKIMIPHALRPYMNNSAYLHRDEDD